MEFKSLNNIETSFRQIRLFALVFICLCVLVTGFAVWNSYSFAEKQRAGIHLPVRTGHGLCRVELVQLRRKAAAEDIRPR